MSDDGRNNGKTTPGHWLAFTPDTDEGAALARFRQKHGHDAAG